MSLLSFIPQATLPVACAAPATDAAGRTGIYVSLKEVNKAYVVFYFDQANAATIACSVVQATSQAGAGSKALSATMPIWSCLDAHTTSVLTRRTDAASYTTDAALKKKIVVIEVDPAALDIANSFAYIAGVTGASNAANLTSIMIYLDTKNQPPVLDMLT